MAGYCTCPPAAWWSRNAAPSARPGDYRMTVLMVRDQHDGHYIYAGLGAVRLEIRDEPVTSWEMAVRPGEDVRTLPDGHWYGFPVDGGTGTFYDAAANDIATDVQLARLVFEPLPQAGYAGWGRCDTPGLGDRIRGRPGPGGPGSDRTGHRGGGPAPGRGRRAVHRGGLRRRPCTSHGSTTQSRGHRAIRSAVITPD
jgi:uncharacterized protein DUF4241